jgi:hypothetical protein
MGILRLIGFFMAILFAGAVIVGAFLAFSMVASVIGVLIAGAIVVALLHGAWRAFRSSRKARK